MCVTQTVRWWLPLCVRQASALSSLASLARGHADKGVLFVAVPTRLASQIKHTRLPVLYPVTRVVVRVREQPVFVGSTQLPPELFFCVGREPCVVLEYCRVASPPKPLPLYESWWGVR